MEYSGDHRICDNSECMSHKMKTTQDISWIEKCVTCGRDLTNAPKAERI